MSGGRYTLAELYDENAEWRVIDNDSGFARTPASLSGGEQFIASLALGLGMVEMIARPAADWNRCGWTRASAHWTAPTSTLPSKHSPP